VSNNGFEPCFIFQRKRRHTSWVSAWSSDVCSSDLPMRPALAERGADRRRGIGGPRRNLQLHVTGDFLCHGSLSLRHSHNAAPGSDRKSVVEGISSDSSFVKIVMIE